MNTEAGAHTMPEALDYKIVEQDYEDEMTATQLLNKEIAEAALKLSDDDATSDLPLASVTDLGVTAQLPDADKEADEDDVTVEMPARSRESS